MDQITVSGQIINPIHFVFQVGPERIACMPNMTEFHTTPYHRSYARSNDPRAVTCPACKKSTPFAEAMISLQNPRAKSR